jgi:myo-inositol-1(or 4)-monophosphatase
MSDMTPKRGSGKRSERGGSEGGRNSEQLKRCLIECVRAGGQVLRTHFGKLVHPRQKESPSSIVCDADLAAERVILKRIRAQFPGHNVIAEESGCDLRGSDFTWVIDPLDGTSNFVAGLPWFGTQIAVLRAAQPIMGAMYLPLDDILYFAETGKGAFRNGRRVQTTRESNSHTVLCAFGFDPSPERRTRSSVDLLFRISRAVRNTRGTNSLVDFCYTIDGRFGACINLKTMIWDIAPVSVILPEAGGKFTYVDGRPISFELDARSAKREYPILGASARLHPQLARLTRALSR